MNTKKYFYWLDWMRFISAFLVILAHYRGMFFVEYGILPESQHTNIVRIFYFLTRFGEQPVLVFFVLSGFLVGGKAIEQILTNYVNIKSYIVDRMVRIFLPLIASSLFVIFVNTISAVPIPYIDILGSLFSLQGIITSSAHNIPLWSLSYEVWFYVMMGCIMTFCFNKIQKKNIIYIFFLFSITLFIFQILRSFYLFIWFMGAFTYLLPRENISFKKLKIFIIAILLFISFGLSQLVSASRSIKINFFSFLNTDNTSMLLAFFTCLFIHYLITATPNSKIGIKIDKIGSHLAGFSYSLYLTHYPLMSLLKNWGFPKSEELSIKSISLYILEVFLAMLTSYLIYSISEKHTYKIKNLIKSKI